MMVTCPPILWPQPPQCPQRPQMPRHLSQTRRTTQPIYFMNSMNRRHVPKFLLQQILLLRP